MTEDEIKHGETSPATIETAIAQAMSLVARYPACFWFWHPDARIESAADVRLVVQNLRKFGGRHAWFAAQYLDQCLSAISRKAS